MFPHIGNQLDPANKYRNKVWLFPHARKESNDTTGAISAFFFILALNNRGFINYVLDPKELGLYDWDIWL